MKFQKRKLLESSKKNNQNDSISVMNPLGYDIICTEKCQNSPPSSEKAYFVDRSLERLMNDLKLDLAASKEDRNAFQLDMEAFREEERALQLDMEAFREEERALQLEMEAFREEERVLQLDMEAFREEEQQFVNILKKDHDALFGIIQHSLVDNMHVSVNQFIRDFENVFIRKFVPPAEYKSSNNCRVKFSDLSIKVRKQLRRDENIARFMNFVESIENARNQTSLARFESQISTDSIVGMDYLLGKMDKLTLPCQERLLCAQFLLTELNSIKRSLPDRDCLENPKRQSKP
jgi:hypothetical protein